MITSSKKIFPCPFEFLIFCSMSLSNRPSSFSSLFLSFFFLGRIRLLLKMEKPFSYPFYLRFSVFSSLFAYSPFLYIFTFLYSPFFFSSFCVRSPSFFFDFFFLFPFFFCFFSSFFFFFASSSYSFILSSSFLSNFFINTQTSLYLSIISLIFTPTSNTALKQANPNNMYSHLYPIQL